MANYRQIHVSIWKDEWFLDLGPDEKLFFIYLFSNESASLAGIYKLPLRVMAFETGIDMNTVQTYLDKFEKADKVFYSNGVVWVKNLRKYNQGSPKIDIRIKKDLDEIPYCDLKAKYMAYYGEKIPYVYGTDTVSYEMKCNEMESNEIITPPTSIPFPTTPKEALEHPDIKLFYNVSGITPGFDDYAFVIDSVRVLRNTHPDEGDLASYMTTFWNEWTNPTRKTANGEPYNRKNPKWLEWAINNDVPPIRSNKSYQHSTEKLVDYSALRLAAEAAR